MALSLALVAPVMGQEHAPPAGQQKPEAKADVHAPAAAEGRPAEEEHESGWGALIARLGNFAILVGVLVYFLRSPIVQHFSARYGQVRHDLDSAAEMRDGATQQLEEIDRRLQALPGELDALRARGAEEIAAEEKRIRDAAAADRERLLEQTRREIDLQLRIARRDLTAHAANLAVGVAVDRLKKSITEDDQRRLVDRYLEQVGRQAPGTSPEARS